MWLRVNKGEIIMCYLENQFWKTRSDAKVAYRKWKEEEEKHGKATRVDYYANEYYKAWARHNEVNMAFFLDECTK
jgi:hypothetical protein